MGITVVANNIMAMYTSRQLNINASDKQKSMEKLASGYRINRAADDAAGLSISEKMRKQIRGLARGEQNSQDGISFCQVADGAMSEIHSMLQRMQELCVQAANGTNSPEDKTSIQREINQLIVEIDRISDTTTFNDNYVFHDEDSVVKGLGQILGDGKIKGGSSMGEPLTINRSISTTGDYVIPRTEGQPGKAGLLGRTYASTMMDFSDMGSSYNYDDLLGISLGVNDSENNMSYNIILASSEETSGRPYIFSSTDTANTLTINIEGINDGNALVNKLFSAIGNTPEFTNAGIQYAKDNNSKLWIYDNQSANLNNSKLKFSSPADSNDEEKGKIWIQSGDTKDSGIWINKPYMNTGIIGISNIDVSTDSTAKAALQDVSYAIDKVSELRGMIGAEQNRMEHTINVTAITRENLESSESKIRDTDMAAETVKLSKTNILEQAGQTVLAQANQAPESILQLLQ